MNDDLISRKMAIDAIIDHIKEKFAQRDTPLNYISGLYKAEDIIEILPSAQPVDKDINVPTNDTISRQAAIDAVWSLDVELRPSAIDAILNRLNGLPTAQPEWNNHTVACLLAELFDDTCACNYNGIDEWLPEKCELLDACPHPVGVACWEQFLKHKAERGTDE